MQVRASKLAKMTPSERERAMDELVTAARAPRNGQTAGINARIRSYESQYGMDSAAMRARFMNGEVPDNEDISSWLMLISARDRGR